MDRRTVAAAVGVGLALNNRPGGADWTQAFEALGLAMPELSAVQVTGWDPVASRYAVIAEQGYPSGVSADLTGMPGTPWGQLLRYSDRPLLMDDEGLGFRASPHYRDWLAPAGYDDGLGACLRDEAGRPAGFIQMSAGSPAAFGEAARAFVAEVAPFLVPHVDPCLSPHVDAAYGPDWAGNRIAPDGRVLPLRARPDGPAARDPGLRSLAVRFAALREPRLEFLWPVGGRWHQAVLLAAGRSRYAGAALLTRAYANDSGLTAREVDVLTAIAAGHANPVIAERLTIGRRTVETYVERLLAKLDCSSRSELAAVAARNGLVRPRPGSRDLGDLASFTRTASRRRHAPAT